MSKNEIHKFTCNNLTNNDLEVKRIIKFSLFSLLFTACYLKLILFFSFFTFFIFQARFAPVVTAPLAKKAIFAIMFFSNKAGIGHINHSRNAFYSAISHKNVSKICYVKIWQIRFILKKIYFKGFFCLHTEKITFNLTYIIFFQILFSLRSTYTAF